MLLTENAAAAVKMVAMNVTDGKGGGSGRDSGSSIVEGTLVHK
jgi:hypothetical protein